MKNKEFFEEMHASGLKPSDPFGHALDILEPEEMDLKDFNDLVNKDIILSNLGDDQLLRLYQNDVTLLCVLFDMAKRYPKYLKNFLNVLYFSWRSELMLTRAKDGQERKLQANVSGYQPQKLSGFGSGYGAMEETGDSELKELIKMLRNRRGGRL